MAEHEKPGGISLGNITIPAFLVVSVMGSNFTMHMD